MAGTLVPPLNGGTGVANANTMTTTRVGAFGLTVTLTGTTSVTFPTSGTLATTAGTVATATNLAGGAAGQIPYQSGVGATAFDANLTWDATNKRVTIGNGSGASSGWVIGNNDSGASGIYWTGGAVSTATVRLYADANQTLISAPTGAAVYIGINALPTMTVTNGLAAVTGALTVSTNMSAVNITTTATSSTGTAVVLDGSNVLRPLTSSRRFKNVTDEHWTPSDDMVRSFLATPAIKWDYRENGARDVVGFGAEDLSVVGRELVNYDAEGKPYSNRDHAIMAMMKEIIKRQQEQIDGIETKLEKQSQEIAPLRGQVYTGLKMAETIR